MPERYLVEAQSIDNGNQEWREIASCPSMECAVYVAMGAEHSDRIRISQNGEILVTYPAEKENVE